MTTYLEKILTHCNIHYARKQGSVFIGHLCKSAYAKEVISPIQNFVFKPKRSLKIQTKIPAPCLQRVDLLVSPEIN